MVLSMIMIEQVSLASLWCNGVGGGGGNVAISRRAHQVSCGCNQVES